MIAAVVNVLKRFAHVDSPLPIVVLLGVAAAWLYLRPRSRGPRRLVVAAFVGYWFLATPLGAGALTWAMSRGLSSLPSKKAAGGASTIVVMGGGEQSFRVGGPVLAIPSSESALRTLEAARVYRMLGGGTIVVSGGRVYPEIALVPEATVMHRALADVGIPDADVVEEPRSRNTREEVVEVGAILTARGVHRFILVTAPTHMRRALAAFRLAGFDPVPDLSPEESDQAPSEPMLMPSIPALQLSDRAIYDAAALVYYWMEGWVKLSS